MVEPAPAPTQTGPTLPASPPADDNRRNQKHYITVYLSSQHASVMTNLRGQLLHTHLELADSRAPVITDNFNFSLLDPKNLSTEITTVSSTGGTRYRIAVTLEQIRVAQSAQAGLLGETGIFRWGKVSNNCATHCRDVLNAGGAGVPTRGDVFKLKDLRSWLNRNATQF